MMNGVQIEDYGEAAIRCNSWGNTNHILVKDNSRLVLSGSGNIPILINNGSIRIEEGAEIVHEENGYTVYADANSHVYDNAEALALKLENGSGTYYVPANRSDSSIAVTQAEVHNEADLISALEDSSINEIIIGDDIALSSNENITVQGVLKKIIGNNHTITYERYQRFTSNTYLTVSDLKVECGEEYNSSSIYWSLDQGCEFSNVEAKELYLYAGSCKSSISDCELYTISLSGGNNSEIIGTTVYGTIYIGDSANTRIVQSEIRGREGQTGISYSGESNGGQVIDTNIYGGNYGVESTVYNRGKVTLTNVNIEGCSKYGVYVHSPHSGARIIFDKVSVSNSGSNSVYLQAAGELSIINTGNSIDKPVACTNSRVTVEGEIEGTCADIIVTDYQSTVVDNNKLIKLNRVFSSEYAYRNVPTTEERLKLPENLQRIEEEAFKNVNIVYVDIPEEVTEIKNSAFADNSLLQEVVILNPDIEIADNAFENSPNVYFVCDDNSAALHYAIEHSIPIRVNRE